MNRRLKGALLYQRRSYLSFFSIFFLIYTAVLVFLGVSSIFLTEEGSIVNDPSITISGAEAAAIVATFVVGLVTFKEDFYFFLQNGLDRKTMQISFVLDGVRFSLIFAILSILYNYLVQWVMSFAPDKMEILFLGGDGPIYSNIFLIFASFTMAYFLGLALTSINYRLSKRGRIVFWSLLGIITFLILPLTDQVSYISDNKILSQLVVLSRSNFYMGLFFLLIGIINMLIFLFVTRRAQAKYEN